ncbi:MAG: SPFH domain-containing protein, partial [Flavobacteriales bacterium]
MEILTGNIIAVIIVALLLFKSFVVIQQGMMGVVTVFGKYRRVLSPGLNFTIPFIEVV